MIVHQSSLINNSKHYVVVREMAGEVRNQLHEFHLHVTSYATNCPTPCILQGKKIRDTRGYVNNANRAPLSRARCTAENYKSTVSVNTINTPSRKVKATVAASRTFPSVFIVSRDAGQHACRAVRVSVY